MRKLRIIALMATAALLFACGGEDITSESSTATGTGTTGTGTTGTGESVVPASLTAISSESSIPADGSAPATITVLARNANNNLISGVVVSFSASSGGIAVTQATTDATGSAIATLNTAGDPSLRTITVTATAAGLTATVAVPVVTTGSGATSTVSSLTLTTSASSVASDGSTTAIISALAKDASNNTLSGVPVTFSASDGAVAVTQATTNSSGVALATLSGTGDTALTPITVTGKTAALSSTVKVLVVAPATTPVYAMGNGSGTAFQTGKIAIAAPTLSAGGSSGFSVTIVDENDVLYSAGAVTITLSSPCIAGGEAEILVAGSTTPVTSIATTTGSVSGTYVAKGCMGSDTITATATIGSQSLSATGAVTVAAASVGSIQFVSATPTTIGLKGTGLNETSTVIFKVTDSTGAAKSGVTVSFSLDTTVGGMSLSPTSATSASDGTVQTVVSAGTVHTVVRVTANIASPALSTQSSQLTVTTGLPASSSFSIAVAAPTAGAGSDTLACPNVEAWGIDGVTVPVSVRLADRYGNPVPDGTAVAFTTNAGHIAGTCSTPAVTSGDGTCSVNWVSANPRPADTYTYTTGDPSNDPFFSTDTPTIKASGRATILATAIGEESFTDVNGSGFWQAGDPFVNLGEPYRDDNENGVYDSGEYFLDFNQNGKRDTPSGSFVGITCTGTSATSTCSTSTLAISASHLIIMSTSGATAQVVSISGFTYSGALNTTPNPPANAPNATDTLSLSIGVSGSGSLAYQIEDENGNPMAAGTSITFAVDNPTIGSFPSGSFTVGCASDVGGQKFEASFNASTTAGSGNVTVTVVSPNGTKTVFQNPLTVH